MKRKNENMKTIEFYTENLEQPIICDVELNKYGSGSGKYILGFEIGDTINIRMMGFRNTDVYGFKIIQINEHNMIALHPRTNDEYNISLDKVKVSSGRELRFYPVKETYHWLAFLDLDREMFTQLVTYNKSESKRRPMGIKTEAITLEKTDVLKAKQLYKKYGMLFLNEQEGMDAFKALEDAGYTMTKDLDGLIGYREEFEKARESKKNIKRKLDK